MYGCIHSHTGIHPLHIHFKTAAAEVEIHSLEVHRKYITLLTRFGSAFLSSKEGSVPVLLSI